MYRICIGLFFASFNPFLDEYLTINIDYDISGSNGNKINSRHKGLIKNRRRNKR